MASGRRRWLRGGNGIDSAVDAGQRSGETETTSNPDHETDEEEEDAPESLDFQPIYNAAFELRRSSLDPGRRAAFEGSVGGVADCDGCDGVDAPSLAASLAPAGDTSAELKLRGRSTPLLGIKPHTFFKLAATAAIGIGTGAIAASLGAAVDGGLKFRNRTVHSIVRSHGFSARGVALAALFAASWAALLSGLSALLVAALAPVAAGSGVSLVMAYLNGNAVADLLVLRTTLVKWAGTGLAVSSGITLGLEAPLVHLGACVASLCADAAGRAWEAASRVRFPSKRESDGADERRRPLLLKEENPKRFIPILQSDAERREFVSAGVAAGLAAAFGAPVGGVLFAMEEASTHWSRKVSWRAFLAATASAVALSQLNPKAFGVLRFAGLAPLTGSEWKSQLPLLSLVAALGGLIGAGFQALHRLATRRARRARDRRKNEKRALIFAFVARASLTSAAIILSFFALSLAAGRCIDVPEWRDKGYGFVLTCDGGLYNDLATLFFAPPADTVRHVFSSGALTPRFAVCSGGDEEDSCYFTLRSLALLCPSYLVAMAASAATGLPGGLFLPSIVAGGSFGGTAGLLLSRAFPAMKIQAGLFAMVGATAALGGVFRASVALVVLVVEGTQSVRFLLAIAVAAIAANWAGDLCRPRGIYESDLEADGRVVFLRPTPPPALHARTAGSVAARGVWAFREVESVSYVLDVLSRTKHNGFPVVREEGGAAREGERKEKESTAAVDAAADDDAPSPPSSSAASSSLSPDIAGAAEEQTTATSTTAPTSSREGVLVGLVLRSQLLVLLEARFFCDARGRPLPRSTADAAVASATAAAEAAEAAEEREEEEEGGRARCRHHDQNHRRHHDQNHRRHRDEVSSLDAAMRSFFRLHGAPTRRQASLVPALQDALSRQRRQRLLRRRRQGAEGLAEPALAPLVALSDCHVDLRPFMDRGTLSVRPESPAERAHAAFVALGLRHLPLTTADGRLCGVITRKDLDAAAGAGPWRRSRIARAPAPPPPGGLHVPSEFLDGDTNGGGAPLSSASPSRLAAGVGANVRRRAKELAARWQVGRSSSSSLGNLQQRQQQAEGGGGEGSGGDERV